MSLPLPQEASASSFMSHLKHKKYLSLNSDDDDDLDVIFLEQKTTVNKNVEQSPQVTRNKKKSVNNNTISNRKIEIISLDGDEGNVFGKNRRNNSLKTSCKNKKQKINHFLTFLSSNANGNVEASILEFEDSHEKKQEKEGDIVMRSTFQHPTPEHDFLSSRIMHMNISDGTSLPTMTTKKTKRNIKNPVISSSLSSLPKLTHHVIENTKSSKPPSHHSLTTNVDNEDDYNDQVVSTPTNRCDSCSLGSMVVDTENTDDAEHRAATSPFRSSNSETSSAISSCCSSDHETNCVNDFLMNDGTTLDIHDDVQSPDSPDSGLSGSLVDSPDSKSLYDELEDFYHTIYASTKPVNHQVSHYINGNKYNSRMDLIRIKTNRKHIVETDENHRVSSEGPISESESKHIEINENILNHEDYEDLELTTQPTIITTATVDDETIQNSFSNNVPLEQQQKLPDENVIDDEIRFEKEIEAIVQSIPKGFDSVMQVICGGIENHSENNDQFKVEDERTEQSGISNSFDFGFDFPMEPSNSSSNHHNNKLDSSSFDWSIKTQGGSGASTDMQAMIKQMKMNARSIHKINNANIGKKQQTFCCQWHDCDWPGNYEDLAEHLREIHVELQPFLDSNGKVIKWNKRQKASKINNIHKDQDESMSNSMIDDFDGSSSQTTLDDETNLDTDDEDCNSSTEDDNQSSKFSSIATRRRARNLQYVDSCSGSIDHSRRSSSKKNSSRNASDKSEKFVCLWRGCKVFGKPSLSRHWIERHVLEQHSGPKPFKCIVDGCGQRFRTQNQLEKHVNMHFKSSNYQQSVTDLKQFSMMKMNNNNNNNNNNNSNINNNNQKIQMANSINDGNGFNPKADSCCKCHCHSFLTNNNCDTTNMSSTFGDESSSSSLSSSSSKRTDKTNRSASVDSGISLQSSCSSSIFDVSSLPSSSSSTQCLSKQVNFEHCHTACCCLIKITAESYSKSPSKASSSKNNKNKKSNPLSALPMVKSVANTDYLDDRFALRLAYEVRTREALLSGLHSYPAYHKWVRLPNGSLKRVETQYQSKSICEKFKELKSKTKNEQTIKHSRDLSTSSSTEILNVFKKELFTLNRKGNVNFESDLIACKTRSDDECFYTLRWHPQGILNDENIHEAKLDKKRMCSVKYSRLPNHVQKSFGVAFKRNKDTKSEDTRQSKRSDKQSRKIISRSKTQQQKYNQQDDDEYEENKFEDLESNNSKQSDIYKIIRMNISDNDENGKGQNKTKRKLIEEDHESKTQDLQQQQKRRRMFIT